MRYNYVMDITKKETDFHKFAFTFDYNPLTKPQKIDLIDFNVKKDIRLKEYYSIKSLKIVNKIFNAYFMFNKYIKYTNPRDIEE